METENVNVAILLENNVSFVLKYKNAETRCYLVFFLGGLRI